MASFVVALLLRPGEHRGGRRWKGRRTLRGLLGAAPGMRSDERHMVQPRTLGQDRFCVISRVHQIVQIDHSFGGHSHQRDRYLRVMHAGTAEIAADRDLPIGNVKVQFVSAPVMLVTLAILLNADVALLRQLGQHLVQGLVALAFNARTALGRLGAGKPRFARFGFCLAFALRLAAASGFVSGKRSRAWMAVESRAICPIKRFACVRSTTASWSNCGSRAEANSEKTRENLDSCGSALRPRHPQNRRSASSTRRRSIRSRVVDRLKIALAINAVAKAARSLAGRPVRDRRPASRRLKGIRPVTEASNCICGLSGPRAVSRRGNSSC